MNEWTLGTTSTLRTVLKTYDWMTEYVEVTKQPTITLYRSEYIRTS